MKAITNKYVLAGIAAVLVTAFLLGARLYKPQDPAAPGQARLATSHDAQLVRPHSPTLGPADAAVTIVEFLDPECESCAAMSPIVKDVMREFDGKVRLVVRYMPLHRNSMYAASLLEGARPHDRYWPLMDKFFSTQPAWADHDAPRPELLLGYARELGLDDRLLQEATRNPDTARHIELDKLDGIALGVTGTPTFFVNGRKLDRLGYQPLRTAVSDALAGR